MALTKTPVCDFGKKAEDFKLKSIDNQLISLNDIVELKEKIKDNIRVKSSIESVARRGVPDWLELNPEKIHGTIKRLPNREDFKQPVDEQLIIEFYSKL